MLHKNVALADRHAPHNWEYADAAARTAATGFVSGDVGKLALQLSDGSYWRLTATTPTWAQMGGVSPNDHSHANKTFLDALTALKTINGQSLVGTGNLVIAGGGGAMTQQSGTLSQGQSLTITHVSDTSYKRLVSIVKDVATSGARLNPIITGADARATSSSNWGGYAPWMAFKAETPGTADFWESANAGANQWIAWNFEAATTIVGVRFFGYSTDTMPAAVTIQGSDNGTDWTDVHVVSSGNSSGGYRTYSFTGATFSRWRLFFPQAPSRGDTIVGGIAFLSAPGHVYTEASRSDYTITYTETTTVLTRTASGSETVMFGVVLAG